MLERFLRPANEIKLFRVKPVEEINIRIIISDETGQIEDPIICKSTNAVSILKGLEKRLDGYYGKGNYQIGYDSVDPEFQTPSQ